MKTRTRKALLGCSAALLVLGFSTTALAQQRRFNLPAQDAATAIPAFALQAGVRISAPTSDLKGITTPAIRGDLDAREALNQLIAGTGLVVASDDGSMIMLRKADAQIDRSGSSQPGPLSPAVVDDGYTVADLVVTATRRQENLSDVPISITAITAEQIDRRGLTSAGDYLRGIPGVNQVEGTNGQSIVIRGVETSANFQSYSAGPTTATYFGETPTTYTAGLAGGTNVDIKLVDIERVEVLRGPQGTAFGNSSMGGAVRTIPVAPRLTEIEGKVAGTLSSTAGLGGRNHDVQAIINVPLVEDLLAIRAVAYQFKDSGYYQNLAGSNAAFQAATASFGAGAYAIDDKEVGGQVTEGGRIAALFRPNEQFKLTLSHIAQKSVVEGPAFASVGDFDHTAFQVAPSHRIDGHSAGGFRTKIAITNATAEYDFGWADLTASYSRTRSGSLEGATFQLYGTYSPTSVGSDANHREKVGEVRLATKFDGPINLLGGIYVEDLEDDVVFDYRWLGSPATCASCQPGTLFVGAQREDWSIKQKAAFGEVAWQVTPTVKLTGGARAYDYDRANTVSHPSGWWFAPDTSTTTDKAKAKGTTFKANASWEPNEDTLVYAGWSQGFRLGRPQAPLSAAACDVNPRDGNIDGTNVSLASTGKVDSDSLDSYEVGSKLALFDRRLLIDAAVYRMDWNDLPVRIGVNTCTRAVVYTANAGSARIEGLEFQGKFRASPAVRVDFGASLVKARLTEDVPAQGFEDGDRLPSSPKFNANLGVQYDTEIGDYHATLRADSIYVGSYYGDILQSPNTKAGGYVKLDLNARIEAGQLAVDLFVNNLTNEDDFTFKGITPSTGRPLLGEAFGYRLRPRTVGTRLSYRF